jgi:hypothetical protein
LATNQFFVIDNHKLAVAIVRIYTPGERRVRRHADISNAGQNATRAASFGFSDAFCRRLSVRHSARRACIYGCIPTPGRDRQKSTFPCC